MPQPSSAKKIPKAGEKLPHRYVPVIPLLRDQQTHEGARPMTIREAIIRVRFGKESSSEVWVDLRAGIKCPAYPYDTPRDVGARLLAGTAITNAERQQIAKSL
jgi:hypothetical protein